MSKASLENMFSQGFYISQVARMIFLKILRYGLDKCEFVIPKLSSKHDDFR